MKKIIILLSAVLLLGFSSCEKVNTETGTRIEVKVTLDGNPASGVRGYLYSAYSECFKDEGTNAIQNATSTDDDVIFGELEADKEYNVKVKVGDEWSYCKRVTTKLDEMVTLTINL